MTLPSAVVPPTPRLGAPTSALLEREFHIDAAQRLLDRARAGRGGTIFVFGDAGLGKTALLEETRSRAAPDMSVGQAQADRMETFLALGLLSDLTESLAHVERWEGADMWASERPSPSASSYRYMKWLRAVASRPVLITLDDLQWSDAASLALLAFVCRRISTLPIAIVASLRRWPPRAAEVGLYLVDSGHADSIELPPLSARASGRLLSHIAGDSLDESAVTEGWRASGGNPYLLGTVAGAREASASTLAGSWSPRSTLDEGGLCRFACLTEHGRRVAQAASVLEPAFHYEVIASVAGMNEDDTLAALEMLCRSGLLIQAEGGGTEFKHPLVRQAIREGLSAPQRAWLEQRAAAALRAGNRRSEPVAIPSPVEPLTGGEQRVAQLAAQGVSNQELARRLHITVNTVETHLKRVYAKLGIHSRRDLMLLSRDVQHR